MCCMPSFFHCSCLIGLIFLHFLPIFSIHIWLIASMAFSNIYKFVFLYFTIRYSTLFISSLYATSFCNNPLPSSLIVTYRLSVSASYTLLAVFLVVFFVSSNLQLIIPKLYLSTGMGNTPIAVMSSLAFNTDFSIILNFLVYSICMQSFRHLLMMYTFTFPQPQDTYMFFFLFKLVYFSGDVKCKFFM